MGKYEELTTAVTEAYYYKDHEIVNSNLLFKPLSSKTH